MKRLCLLTLLIVYGCTDEVERSRDGSIMKSDEDQSQVPIPIGPGPIPVKKCLKDVADSESQLGQIQKYLMELDCKYDDVEDRILRSINSCTDQELRMELVGQYCTSLENVHLEYREMKYCRLTLDRYYQLIDSFRNQICFLDDRERFYRLVHTALLKGKIILHECKDELRKAKTAKDRTRIKNRRGDIETSLFVFTSRIKNDYLDWGRNEGILNNGKYDYWKGCLEKEISAFDFIGRVPK